MAYEQLLTVQEAAYRLSVTVQWLYDHTTRIKPIVPQIRMGA